MKLPGYKLSEFTRHIALMTISTLGLAMSHSAAAQQGYADRGCQGRDYQGKDYQGRDYQNKGYDDSGYYGSGYDNRGYYDNRNYGRGRSGMGSGMGMGSGSGHSYRGYDYDHGYQRPAPRAYRYYHAPTASQYGYQHGTEYGSGYRGPAAIQDSAAGGKVATSPEVDVRIAGMQYSPAPLKARVGEEVIWMNADGMPHTVTSRDGGPLDSGQLGKGDTYAFTFTEPGTYEYYCAYHPSMKGTVIVE